LTDDAQMRRSDRTRDGDEPHQRREERDVSVAVIIAARDRSDRIERALKSALSEPNVRTVIVIDETAPWMAAIASRCDLNDDRLIVRSLPANRGAEHRARYFDSTLDLCA
jgi:hypothetical protein